MTGQEMRNARKKLRMTQAEFGEAIGLHWNSIARQERGELPIQKSTELAIRYLLLVKSKERK